MSFQVKEPILIVGLGGAGAKLAIQAREMLDAGTLIISNDQADFTANCDSIKISTGPVVNPTIQLIRGSTFNAIDEIKSKISDYSTVILMANMAGKSGSAISPVVSSVCKEMHVGLVSFAVMPFKYEKERMFNAGISLKRVRADSDCTIVLDNDSLLESNPDLSPKQCYKIGNDAIMHVVNSLNRTEILQETSILSTSKNQDIEESLRDSLKMLYAEAPPSSVKCSILYVVGGENIPVGILNSVSSLAKGVINEESQMETISDINDEPKVVMLSTVQGMTKFDRYDPLGMIPLEQTLDWSEPECSIGCNLELYQLE